MEANLSFVIARSTTRLRSKQYDGACERAPCASAIAGKLAIARASSPAFAWYRLTDLAIFFGRISCICRIRSCMSLRSNLSCTLVVDLDIACKCSIQLVLQWCFFKHLTPRL